MASRRGDQRQTRVTNSRQAGDAVGIGKGCVFKALREGGGVAGGLHWRAGEKCQKSAGGWGGPGGLTGEEGR